jgi:catechol 2,3-dioxygenase-like lactoylglutathione lyase family enzyme
VTVARVHHSAIQVRNIDASLRFYRDGIGLEVLMDHVFEGEWPALFDAPSTTLRSIFLGDRRHPDAGIVELVSFDVVGSPVPPVASPAGGAPSVSRAPVSTTTSAGFFLLSFYVDVDEVLARLAALGFGPARRISQPGAAGPVAMASLCDPDGTRIEFVGVAAG